MGVRQRFSQWHLMVTVYDNRVTIMCAMENCHRLHFWAHENVLTMFQFFLNRSAENSAFWLIFQ